MSPSSSRRRLRAEDSWRMVEGENDSFDTSILASFSESSPPAPPSSSSTGLPTQPFSQDGLSFASQDSIRDFAANPDDEQVILREPFRPSLSGINISASGNSAFRTPDPEFRMPRVDIGSEGTGSGRTIRGLGIGFGGGDNGSVRRRGNTSHGSPSKQRSGRRRYDDQGDDYYRRESRHERHTTIQGQLAESIPNALFGLVAWLFGVVGLAFRYAQRPLAILLAIYLSFGGIIIAQNMATRSITASLSPLCRLPGASFLNLPFCPASGSIITDPSGPPAPVEFDDLMSVQAQFEQVLEKSADGVSLPFEMKRSETAIRDLRSLVRHSDLQVRDELLFEFDGYVDTARRTASDLQKFNTHVGSAVDAVISINRWTSRYIDTLAPESPDDVNSPPSSLVGWTSWLFHPFQPTDHMFNERILLDKYIEHTALVSERIATLILEAQAVLRLLTKAEDHLGLIYEITSRSSADTAQRRESVFWTIWTLVGANSARLNSLSQQLVLLRQVDRQRSSAIVQVNALILELEAIQAGLGDLRDRVAEPALLQNSNGPAIPLTVHIETIDRGVERLEDARRRIRAAENDRVRDALASGGLRDSDRMLEADHS
ncbi:hypothetical protein AK830_g9422 [Neonectria ditissima]|uniref:Uncharacterized protein n=1 Tax=Neonectria ditissima TaxID=78410 RepID=A0A0P7B945_9HYPO|nr:hypothetical protein AK830_g9422 [Neonectria ditissima]